MIQPPERSRQEISYDKGLVVSIVIFVLMILLAIFMDNGLPLLFALVSLGMAIFYDNRVKKLSQKRRDNFAEGLCTSVRAIQI
jgi:4-hydroxybenzoate polyprenyltransferase